MSEFEDHIRDVLTDRASRGELDPHLAPPIAKRARRRQIGTVVMVSLATMVIVIGIVGMVASVRSGGRAPVPASVGAIRDVTLDGWTISYPSAWYLVEFPGGDSVQLTNFDPAFTRPCFSGDGIPLPHDGALLLVSSGSGPVDDPAGPPPLEYDPAASACRPGALVDRGDLAPGEPEHWSSSWTSDAAGPVTANAMFGAEAEPEDRAAIRAALASVELASPAQPSSAIESTRLVLDVMETPAGQAVLTVDRATPGDATFLSVSGAFDGGISMSEAVPDGDAGTTMTASEAGSVVWGTVTSEAASAELQTQTGERSPATLVPLPASLGLEGQQAVWGVLETATQDRVGVLLFDGAGRPLNEVEPVLEERTTIATGEDPDAGPWTFALERTDEGIGFALEFDGGGSSGCCLSPLDGEVLRLHGAGGGEGPSDITAVGSEALASVVFESSDGTRVEGGVYDMPPNEGRIPKAVLVLVPPEVALDGSLIGYDAAGTEIARESLADLRIGSPNEQEPGLADGSWFGFVRGVDAESRTIVFDDAEWLTGDEADDAWQAAGNTGPVPNDYFVRNEDRTPTTLSLASDAAIRLLDWNDCCETFFHADLATWAEAIATGDDIERDGVRYRGISSWWITVSDGVVTRVDEQYTP